jgi:hypothetical protein
MILVPFRELSFGKSTILLKKTRKNQENKYSTVVPLSPFPPFASSQPVLTDRQPWQHFDSSRSSSKEIQSALFSIFELRNLFQLAAFKLPENQLKWPRTN